MGLNCGAQVLYSLCGLKMGDIVDICHVLASEQGMVTPTIDVDCSNVCFKVGKNVQSVVRHLVKWANTGLCIVPVCDGKVQQWRLLVSLTNIVCLLAIANYSVTLMIKTVPSICMREV